MLNDLDVISRRFRDRLDCPIPGMWSFISWICSTILFFGVSAALGGPVEGDVAESVYGTWTVAHGNLACIYPPPGGHIANDLARPFALTAPLYPLISGAFAALLRIGHSVAFPTSSQLGPNCSTAFVAMFNWSAKSDAILPTIRLSYLVWPVVMIGAVALLRSSGRGRTGWEPAALFLIACMPAVQMCTTYYFHPQDLLAMGLLLAAAACVLKDRWLIAGVLIGLAFSSQQFALLVGVLLLVLAPAKSRVSYVVGVLIALAVVDVPIIAATSGRGVKTVLLGSSRVGSGIRSAGGTILWETNAHGIPLFIISRVLPIAVVAAFAWFVSVRVGSKAALRPDILLSLFAVALITRLVFEENLFGYYFMATAVSLAILDVVCGRIRGRFLAWLALDVVAFIPVHLGITSNLTSWSVQLSDAIPIVILGVIALCVGVDALNRRFRAYKILLLLVIALTSETTLFGISRPLYVPPGWLWQIVLVTSAMALAIGPVLALWKPSESSGALGVSRDCHPTIPHDTTESIDNLNQ
jgi:hypothetical protein